MSVHAPSRQLFRGEIASLVLVVLQAAFSHAAIVFLDRAKVVVIDWRRSASMANTCLIRWSRRTIFCRRSGHRGLPRLPGCSERGENGASWLRSRLLDWPCRGSLSRPRARPQRPRRYRALPLASKSEICPRARGDRASWGRSGGACAHFRRGGENAAVGGLRC